MQFSAFGTRRALLAAIVICGFAMTALARPPNIQTRNTATAGDFGGVGLLQTRTARFRDDGDIDVGGVFIDPYRRYYVSFQAMPWLEGTFRYTLITNRLFSLGGLASDQDFQDRGADLKFRLLEEGSWWPQIAVGLQDGVGTGLFAGEYLVASKRYYDLDFSFGMGWGYFASGSRIKNPLTTFSPVFESRQSSGALGGQANLGDYFSGPNVGLFGGVAWRTPVRGLTLKIEASTQDYQSEPLGNRFDRGLPYNFGLVYRPFSWLELSGAYERGDTAMFRASLRASVNDVDLPKFDKPPPTLKPRTRKQQTAATPPPGTVVAGDADFSLRPRPVATIVQPGDPEPVRPARRWAATDDGATSAQVASPRRHDAVVAHLFDGFEAQRMQISSIETDANEARIYLSAGLREAPQWRMLKAAQLVTASLPARTARVVLIERSGGIVRRRVSLRRNEIERTAIVDYLFDNLEDKGFVIESIDLSHSRARLVMSRVPVFDGDVERQAAEIVFKAAPTPIEKVEIVQLDNGRQLSRAIVRRADVLRAAKIDQMFDGLEAHGFEIESLELSRGRALVYLSSPRHDDQDAYQAAARLVARTAPDPVASVEVVRLIAGVEATRVSWHRSGSTAGTSDERVVPDLTDNEKNQVALKVFKELEDNGFGVEKFEITRRKASVFVTPTQFREYARNVGRASRIVAKHAPPSVEELQVVTMNAGLETARVTIMRKDLEAAVRRLGSPEEIWAHATIEQPRPSPPFGGTAEDATVISNPHLYPNMNWYIRPALRSHVGGPDALYLYQIWLAVSASVDLYRGLSVSATMGKNLKSTLDEITLRSDSRLPRVRSDIKEYVQQGEDGNIVSLYTDYLFQPANNWFARVSAGLFEEMFGGVSGEVLYRPYGSRLALGVDINRVRQREYDQRLDFRNYEVTTGHLNMYYKLPYAGLLFETHSGQFLAGDRGTQFAITRIFDSGVAVGAWATATNVSAEEFGEGSFDKGIYLRVPFELFLTSSTRRAGTIAFRPLTRDGGQMVNVSKRVYSVIEDGNLDNVMHHWNRFLD